MKIEDKNRNAEHQFARQGAVATQRASSKIGHAKQTSNRKTEHNKKTVGSEFNWFLRRDNTKLVAQNKPATERQKTIFWQKLLSQSCKTNQQQKD